MDYHSIMKMTPESSFDDLKCPSLSMISVNTSDSTSVVGTSSHSTVNQTFFAAGGYPDIGTIDETLSIEYPPLHLLGLPAEVRLVVWRVIHYDILLGVESKWHERPTTVWDGLRFTNRQILDEISDFWPRSMVPKAKIGQFLSHPLTFSFEMLGTLRQLSLEIPFGRIPKFYNELALCLMNLNLATRLEHLGLFFTGEDSYGVRTSAKHHCISQTSQKWLVDGKLALDGQGHAERQPIFTVLFLLTRLRSLVIKNANYPLLQSMIVKDKPKLRELHISTDHRSNLHQRHDLSGNKVLMFAPTDNFPPIRVLQISTNAAMSSFQTATKVASTLEELDWTVTDPSRQLYSWPWLQETSVLFRVLAQQARLLRSLRICIHIPIYENHPAYGLLIGGLREWLPQFRNLKTFELHVKSESPYLGREIMEAVPDSLERLYVSDKVITYKQLEEVIDLRYVTSHVTTSFSAASDNTNSDWGIDHSRFARDLQQQVEPSLCIAYNRQKQQSARGCGCNHEEASIEKEQIGEPHFAKRNDFISMGAGKLCFVGYDYDPGAEYNSRDKYKPGEKAKHTLLRVNGRLLDRDHNKHLAPYDGGCKISPKTEPNTATEARGWHNAESHCAPEPSDEFEKEMAELDRLIKKANNKAPHRGYFGMEAKAQELFEREVVARKDELPAPPAYPAEAFFDETQHWLSEGGGKVIETKFEFWDEVVEDYSRAFERVQNWLKTLANLSQIERP